jgi:hypothetical protein
MADFFADIAAKSHLPSFREGAVMFRLGSGYDEMRRRMRDAWRRLKIVYLLSKIFVKRLPPKVFRRSTAEVLCRYF